VRKCNIEWSNVLSIESQAAAMTVSMEDQQATAPSVRPSLDLQDLAILRLLATDARMSQRRIAREVGMSPPAVAERMARLERPDSPFGGGDPPTRGTTWVEPELVAQVAFTEWTRDGRLRHPRHLGLRDDKPARQVVRERPA